MTVSAILSLIAQEIDPKKMTKREALNFLEELVADLEGSIDALKDELRDDEE
jgi:hypothetical protein